MLGGVYKKIDTIFFSIIAGYFLGIIFSKYTDTSIYLYIFLSAIIVLSLLLIIFKHKNFSIIFLSIIFILPTAYFGSYYLDNKTQNKHDSSYENLVGQKIFIEGKIVSDIDQRDTSQRLYLRSKNENSKKESTFLVILPKYPVYKYGQYIRVEGTLQKPESFITDTNREFDYPAYLKKDYVFYILAFAEGKEIISDPSDSLIGFLYNIKNKIVQNMQTFIPGSEGVFASGITFGTRTALPKDLRDLFIITGTIHLVALSGYNVTIVARTFQSLFGLFLPKKISVYIGGISIILFVLAVGAQATSLRAGLMALIAMMAINSGHMYSVFRSLMIATFIMVLLNPFTLLYDVSFHLSVVATLGIIFINPLFVRAFRFLRSRFVIDIVSTTLAAQVAVLPLILYTTGVFSIVSPLANFIVGPLMPFAMFFAFITGIGGVFLPLIGRIFGFLTYYFNYVVLWCIDILGNTHFAYKVVAPFPFYILLLVYLSLIAVLFFWHKNTTSSVSSGSV